MHDGIEPLIAPLPVTQLLLLFHGLLLLSVIQGIGPLGAHQVCHLTAHTCAAQLLSLV